MPHRIALGLILLGGCRFSADYPSGSVTCREGPCPDGLACVENVCVVPADAPPGDGMDGMDTPPPPALTCGDPGTIVLGGDASGDTSDAITFVSASCGGFVNNGPEDVYKLDVPVGTQITLSVASGTRKAYVISTCVQFPSSCLGNARAIVNASITVTTAARPSFIIVDDETAGVGSMYTIHVQ